MREAESVGPSGPVGPGNAPLSFVTLAEIASGDTARIDLCRIGAPEALRGRLVAVKRLHPHLLADRELASMFFDEVWMTASLAHPNVVAVVGWGEDAEGPYLAVELVEGVSLARLVKTVFDTGEIFGERMVVYVGAQICRGLAAAHELRSPEGEPLGLVHRDLTPGNVLIGFEGRVKITDFGLAKAKQRITRTVTGLLKGRPQYMSPEQARGEPIDARADLFSLGVLLFELFAGRRPWSGQTEFEVLATTQNDPPADLLELRPKMDRELAALVMRLLAKDPEARFPSAAEVAARLEEWLAVHGWADGNDEALARFVRRNAMRQMRWFERAIKGELPAPKRKVRGGSLPSMPEASLPSRRERAKRVTDEPTEVSEAAAHAAPRHFQGEPEASSLDLGDSTVSPVRPPGLSVRGPHDEFGEEIPTLVQRDRPLTPSAPVAASVRPPPPAPGAEPPLPGFAISEEDSDGRTTAIKRRSPAAAPAVGGVPASSADEEIADPETETVPHKGPRQRAVQEAVRSARVATGAAQVVPRVGPPPPRARPPGPPPRSAAPGPLPPPAAPPRTSAPPPAPVEGPTPGSIARSADALAELARTAEVEARAAEEEAARRALAAERLAEAADAARAAVEGARATGDLAGAARAIAAAEELARAVERGQLDAPRLAAAHPVGQAVPEPAPGFGPPAPEPVASPFAPPPEGRLSAPPLPPPSLEPARGSFVSLPPELGMRDLGSPSFPPPAPLPGGAPYDPAVQPGYLREAGPAPGHDSPTAMALRFRPLILGLPPAIAGVLAVLSLLALLLLVLVITD